MIFLVISIGSKAFSQCMNLMTVNCFPEVVPETAEDAFGNKFDAPILTSSLSVPQEPLESYRACAPWNAFMSLAPIGGEPETTEFEEQGLRYRNSNPSSMAVTLIGGEITSEDGTLNVWGSFEHDGSSFIVSDYLIPERVEILEPPYSCSGVFENCTSLGGQNMSYNSFSINFLFIIPETWTAIPERLFCNSNLKVFIRFPEDLKYIGKEAFAYNAFDYCLNLNEGLECIDDKAFYYCSYDGTDREIRLPSTIKKLGWQVFSHKPGYKAIERVYCDALTPPVNDERGAFEEEIYESAELIVPDESVELYLSAPDWRRFRTINGKVNTGIAGIDNYTNGNTPVYDLQGRRVISSSAKGLYIKNGRKYIK